MTFGSCDFLENICMCSCLAYKNQNDKINTYGSYLDNDDKINKYSSIDKMSYLFLVLRIPSSSPMKYRGGSLKIKVLKSNRKSEIFPLK